MQEQLAKLAQRERESAATKGLGELSPAFITEKEKADRERDNANMLVRDMFSFTHRHTTTGVQELEMTGNILYFIGHECWEAYAAH